MSHGGQSLILMAVRIIWGYLTVITYYSTYNKTGSLQTFRNGTCKAVLARRRSESYGAKYHEADSLKLSRLGFIYLFNGRRVRRTEGETGLHCVALNRPGTHYIH